MISDLDEAGWAERFMASDPTLAPPGHSLIQAQMPLRPGESGAAGLRRLERLLELGYPGWRDRLVWRRHGTANGRTGALDLPGGTDPGWITAEGCSWSATWSPPRALSARWRSTARWSPAAAGCA